MAAKFIPELETVHMPTHRRKDAYYVYAEEHFSTVKTTGHLHSLGSSWASCGGTRNEGHQRTPWGSADWKFGNRENSSGIKIRAAAACVCGGLTGKWLENFRDRGKVLHRDGRAVFTTHMAPHACQSHPTGHLKPGPFSGVSYLCVCVCGRR